ncbi:hypothetical protein HPB52_001385 [Rhipicephalus sanguineus]|uniref:Monocarboxylate transporter n=1 Tax=Rhipicephalus sanguineus TaxID=34632 RepID=A0A9D4SXD4_RHISA|nr:hypothetical protein HPB52_001385 [Rhipicephalus sanguineus]
MTLPVYINQHFEKYRGFALGIAYAGSTSSAFVFPKLLLYLKNTYNFRSSIMIFGAIVSHVIAASLLLKEPSWIRKKRVDDALALKQAKDIFTIEKEATKTTVNSTAFSKTYRDKKTDTNTAANSKVNPWSIRHGLTVLENPMFYAVMLTYVVFGYNFDVFMATIVDFAVDKGTALEAAVGLIPLFSFTDTLGRLFIPLLVDKGYVTRSCLATVNYLWMSLVLFTFPLVRGYYEIMAACMCLSLAIGCSVTMYPALMADYMGIQRLPISYGIVGAVAGPLFVLKPLFIGFFRDHVGCYSNMYRFLSGGVFVLGLVWLAVFQSERRKRKEWKPQPAGATEAILVDGHAVYCNPGFTATEHRRDPECSTDGRTKGDIECVKACK